MIKDINTSNFNMEVFNENRPVVVDFWATWCGPCKMLAPVMEDVSNELQGKAKFVKVNVDENPGLAQQFGIVSIPTVIVFKNGTVTETMVGFRPKNQIQKAIKQHI